MSIALFLFECVVGVCMGCILTLYMESICKVFFDQIVYPFIEYTTVWRNRIVVLWDYVTFKIRTKLLSILDVGHMRNTRGAKSKSISYYRGDDKFTVIIPYKQFRIRPVKSITLKNIPDLSNHEQNVVNDSTNKILQKIHEYAGPDRNFHGIPTSPNLLGIKHTIVVTYTNGLIREYKDNEIILVDQVPHEHDGYSFFPIYKPQLYKFYEDQKKVQWVTSDIDMSSDRQDFDDLENTDPDLQTFVEGIIAFFVPTDGKVNENIFEYFQKDTSFWKEARAFYAAQADMETTHSKMYSLMADVFIRDKTKLNAIYNAEQTYPSVKRIFGFMNKYMDRSYSLAERIIAFACVEGILFNSAFAAIYWLKKRNILRGFCKANEYIARDEAIHTRFAVALYLLASKDGKITPAVKTRVYEIVSEAVTVNELYIKEILKADKIGMTVSDLINYTKCTADALLVSFGYDKLFNVVNPFDWMAIISLPNKTNFFEDKVSEYSQQTEEEFVFDENAYF